MDIRLDHIALLVRDLDESARFYADVLRIREVPDPMGGGGFRWFEFAGGQRFHLQAGDISTTHVEKGTHIAFALADFDGMVEHLREVGAAFGDFAGTPGAVRVRKDGLRQVFLQDPNGYWIELNDGGA